MNKYTTIDELRSVKRRLYFKKEELEAEIKNNYTSIKESLMPSAILKNLGGSIKNNLSNPAPSTNGTPGVVSSMASTVLELAVNDLFMRRSSYFKKFFMTYLIRLFGPAILKNAGPALSALLKKTGIMSHLTPHETAKN